MHTLFLWEIKLPQMKNINEINISALWVRSRANYIRNNCVKSLGSFSRCFVVATSNDYFASAHLTAVRNKCITPTPTEGLKITSAASPLLMRHRQTDGRTDIRSMLYALRYKHGQRNKATNRMRPLCESRNYIIPSWWSLPSDFMCQRPEQVCPDQIRYASWQEDGACIKHRQPIAVRLPHSKR